MQALKQQEFEAGRYFPVMSMVFFEFPPTQYSESPGAKHVSIEAVFKDNNGCGTGSILDITRVADQPDSLMSSALSSEWVLTLVGTKKTTHNLVERIICREEILDEDNVEDVWDELADEMPRGQSYYFVIYEDNEPSEYFFMGYSID